ncbi:MULTISPECIES: hypothetical protein [unclassified Endozoicomonas]|uniref:hypothetical protein n=1 Tax=unclassified Endozoicomonas TaxID=2644528 RepID=UPI0021483542|nr:MULTISPECIES: hypothetical protein [unclassified Endozoicomonas]
MTERYIVKLEQNAVFPNQSFSIKSDLHPLAGSPSVITDTNSYGLSGFPPDDKPHRSGSYGVKTTVIKSISWQWLYTTHLLFDYELILTAKDNALSSTLYSWLPGEVVFIVGWLLKSYWNPDSLMFNSMEQREATSMLTQWDHTFAAIIMVPAGSGNNQQPYQSSVSSGQHAADANAQPTGFFTGPSYSDFDDGNKNPQQYSHTLDLYCFVHPCHGVCQLRPSLHSTGLDEWPLSSFESSCPHLTRGHCLGCIDYFDLVNVRCSTPAPEASLNDGVPTPSCWSSIADDLAAINGPRNTPGNFKEIEILATNIQSTPKIGTSEPQETTPEPSQFAQSQTLSQTDSSEAPCEHNTGQLTNDATVVKEDGQPRPGKKTWMSVQALSAHKRKIHRRQKICDKTVIGEDGLQRPCGRVYKNIQSLSSHKGREHSGPKICNVSVIGEDRQLLPCRAISTNTRTLSDHKKKEHAGQRTCDLIEVGEDGQLRRCGKICKNAKVLWDHKNRSHSGRQICNATVIGKDGQPRPCGKVTKNTPSLSVHKSKHHSGRKTCYVKVAGDHGLQQIGGVVCKSAEALSMHRSKHLKRKHVDVDQNNDPSSQED